VHAPRVLDPNDPGYKQWCKAARDADPARWDAATLEMREPWIVQARQKELDDAKPKPSATTFITKHDGTKAKPGLKNGPQPRKRK